MADAWSSDATTPPQRIMRERRVPQTPFSRIAAFGALGASLVTGAAAEVTRRALGRSPSFPDGSTNTGETPLAAATSPGENSSSSSSSSSSPFLTEANAYRLADTLSRMRGAALKLGQMLSIQDQSVIPPALSAALQRVRQNADMMPTRQLNETLAGELGNGWRARFVSFNDVPLAAASIGQVHHAVIRADDQTVDVVLKVQYPGVARSIGSDVTTLRRLLRMGNFVPDSYYVDEALQVAEDELARECDYSVEAANQHKYRELIKQDPKLSKRFYVPLVFAEFCTERVLTSEFVRGVPIDTLATAEPALRDRVAHDMLVLTMRELFIFAFQQSDPNWSNYLYDVRDDRINLIDFGAARPYSEKFLASYLSLIRACADRNEEAIVQRSVELGFLTGEESRAMLSAHVAASLAVGEPFRAVNGFNFDGCDIPKRTAKFGKVMLEYRLTPPPKEAYSLHRRLSGAFLLSTKLRATVDAQKILEDTFAELRQSNRLQVAQ